MRICSLEGELLAPTSQESSPAVYIVLFARDNLRVKLVSTETATVCKGGEKKCKHNSIFVNAARCWCLPLRAP